jgi:hypothetical protein
MLRVDKIQRFLARLRVDRSRKSIILVRSASNTPVEEVGHFQYHQRQGFLLMPTHYSLKKPEEMR